MHTTHTHTQSHTHTHTHSLTLHAGVPSEARRTDTVTRGWVAVSIAIAPAVLPAVPTIPVAGTHCEGNQTYIASENRRLLY